MKSVKTVDTPQMSQYATHTLIRRGIQMKRVVEISKCKRYYAKDIMGNLVAITVHPTPGIYGYIVKTEKPITSADALVHYDDEKPDSVSGQK